MKTKYNFSHLVNKKSPEKDWKKAIHYRYEIVSLTWKNTKLSHFKGFFYYRKARYPQNLRFIYLQISSIHCTKYNILDF